MKNKIKFYSTRENEAVNKRTGVKNENVRSVYPMLLLFAISSILIVFSCAPKIQLNKKSGNVQVNEKIELRAKTKRFKTKDGAVDIKWLVNGQQKSSGNNFLFSPSEPGKYAIRAEAAQSGKHAETSITLQAGLYDPELIDLVNGVEYLPVKEESPLKKIDSEQDTLPMEIKREDDKEVRTVWKEVKETYSASKNPDEFVMYDPNANVLWPGALVQGKSVASGVPSIIPISTTHRLPGKVTLSILSGDESGVKNKFFRETEMTKSGVTQAMNDILAGYNGISPAQYSYSKKEVHSSSQLQFDLSMGYAGPVNKVDGKLGVDWSEDKSRMAVKLYQKFFTIAYDDPQGIQGVFKPSIKLEDMKPYVGAGNPACYVSSVTYGRTYVLLYETEKSQLDLNAALNYKYDGAVAEGYVEADLKAMFSNGSISVKAFQIGGDAKGGLEVALDPLNPEKMRAFIADGANFSSENPGEIISYTVNYLKDASLVRMNSAMEYTVTQREPISSKEYIAMPAITGQHRDEAKRNLNGKGFGIRVIGTDKDCSEQVGTVLKQDWSAGDMVQAGTEVKVRTVADRPLVKAQSIPGKGDLHKLKPEGAYSEGAWAGGNTAVAFSVEGDECTEGVIIMKHPLISERKYTLRAGEYEEIKEVFGPGEISIKFVSKDSNARLHLRIW